MSEYLDVRAVCRKVGGSRPLHPSTVYRKVQAGVLPKPVKMGRLASWLESEVDEVLKRFAKARDSS